MFILGDIIILPGNFVWSAWMSAVTILFFYFSMIQVLKCNILGVWPDFNRFSVPTTKLR